ncbi:oxidoreductase, molybdopterin binding protein [Psychromonas ingrahamii 37]|uniref:Protein-methionine-sulfoxide reductase catalytic subunit MsrP n=1 Tax=Psychromonas ingrahamii (strain DSM 17664 / CCUG 51855 / 37) TaxID=357804 RepID=A1SSG5_PSYIN|nr:protein-methionine-sulfoxide reductase catalytic subunit MsrP [Psychromonas ingrahamii]ABM02430.1 oxidoreductase, molybdopterin binding protein [Psychromonas ingrahamii 37]
MLIKTRKKSDIKESQLTDEKVYKNRRVVLKALGLSALSIPLASSVQAGLFDIFSDKEKTDNSDLIFKRSELIHTKNSRFQSLTPLTPEDKILQYNNFYEFGTGKGDPFSFAQQFKVDPWQLVIDGLVDKPITLNYEELLTRFAIEERLYRMRCVEAWSMNIPWLGFSLATLLKMASPKSNAKYVRFETLEDPKQMRGQSSRFIGGGLDYPYVEGLRLDEAMNPLVLLSVGLYGKTLAPQNGAPIRLVVPWKYGFKSIKSIVKITLTDKAPVNTWQKIAANEYGFFANVNPQVDHPRWSQASERFIGPGNLFAASRKPTLPFNGYQEEVASLYKGLDLTRYY